MTNPLTVVRSLSQALNAGDADTALACYEPTAILVVQPGTEVQGHAAIRQALAGFISLRPALRTTREQVMVSGEVALYLGSWSLDGVDPTGKAVHLSGDSTDVLRQQPDGRWLVAIDNPWGAQILSQAHNKAAPA